MIGVEYVRRQMPGDSRHAQALDRVSEPKPRDVTDLLDRGGEFDILRVA